MINETLLLQKYDRDIRIIVNHYLISTQFSLSCSFYEDLISEATIAFLLMCRKFDLQDYRLTDLQRAMIKNKIESVLRVYIWKMFNMGGYNNRKIDLSRSVTISDILRDTDLTIDDVAPNTYQEDFSNIYTEEFLHSLSSFDTELVRYLVLGYSLNQFGKLANKDIKTVFWHIERIRKKYIAYAKSASAA